jgi:hypothetical protein
MFWPQGHGMPFTKNVRGEPRPYRRMTQVQACGMEIALYS